MNEDFDLKCANLSDVLALILSHTFAQNGDDSACVIDPQALADALEGVEIKLNNDEVLACLEQIKELGVTINGDVMFDDSNIVSCLEDVKAILQGNLSVNVGNWPDFQQAFENALNNADGIDVNVTNDPLNVSLTNTNDIGPIVQAAFEAALAAIEPLDVSVANFADLVPFLESALTTVLEAVTVDVNITNEPLDVNITSSVPLDVIVGNEVVVQPGDQWRDLLEAAITAAIEGANWPEIEVTLNGETITVTLDQAAIDAIQAALQAALEAVEVEVTLNGEEVTVNGTVALDQATLDALENITVDGGTISLDPVTIQAIADALEGQNVVIEPQSIADLVAALEAAELTVTLDGETVTVDGAVNIGNIPDLVAALEAATLTVTGNVTVDSLPDVVIDAQSISDLADAIAAALDGLNVTIGNTPIEVTGTVDVSGSTVTATIDNFQDLADLLDGLSVTLDYVALQAAVQAALDAAPDIDVALDTVQFDGLINAIQNTDATDDDLRPVVLKSNQCLLDATGVVVPNSYVADVFLFSELGAYTHTQVYVVDGATSDSVPAGMTVGACPDEVVAVSAQPITPQCYCWSNDGGVTQNEFIGYGTTAADGSWQGWQVISGTEPPAGAVVKCLNTKLLDELINKSCENPGIQNVKVIDSVGPYSIGDTISGHYEITNTGDVELANITVTDDNAVVSGGPLGSLAVGDTDTTTFTWSHVVTQIESDNGEHQNQATAIGVSPAGTTVTDLSGTEANPEGNEPIVVPIAVANPAVELLKSAQPGTFEVGDTVTFDLTVNNTGDQPLTNIAITPTAPDTTTGSVPEPLAVGGSDSSSVKLLHVVTQDDIDTGEFACSVDVTATDPLGAIVTDTSDDPADLTGTDDPTVVTIPQTLAATLLKTGVAPATWAAGEIAEYTFELCNTGNVSITNAPLIDPTLGITAASGLSFAVPLLPNACTVLTYSHTLTAADDAAGQIENVATSDIEGGDNLTATVQSTNDLANAPGTPTVIESTPNQPPEIIPGQQLPPQTNVENQPITPVPTAQKFLDPDGDALTYSATGLPAGLSINPATGEITGTPAVGSTASSPYNVIVTATDPSGASVDCPFTWTITDSTFLRNITFVDNATATGTLCGVPVTITQIDTGDGINGWNTGQSGNISAWQDGDWFQPPAFEPEPSLATNANIPVGGRMKLEIEFAQPMSDLAFHVLNFDRQQYDFGPYIGQGGFTGVSRVSGTNEFIQVGDAFQDASPNNAGSVDTTNPVVDNNSESGTILLEGTFTRVCADIIRLDGGPDLHFLTLNCGNGGPTGQPLPIDDMVPGNLPSGTPQTVDVSANDAPCPAGITSYQLVSGSETNVTVQTNLSLDGNFDYTPQGLGPWSFDYEVLCDGVPSGETATVSGDAFENKLQATKAASPAAVTQGGTVNYAITLQNTGTVPCTNVTVTDVLPNGVTYALGSIAGGDAQTDGDPSGAGLQWVVSSLAPGASVALTYSVLADAFAAQPAGGDGQITYSRWSFGELGNKNNWYTSNDPTNHRDQDVPYLGDVETRNDAPDSSGTVPINGFVGPAWSDDDQGGAPNNGNYFTREGYIGIPCGATVELRTISTGVPQSGDNDPREQLSTLHIDTDGNLSDVALVSYQKVNFNGGIVGSSESGPLDAAAEGCWIAFVSATSDGADRNGTALQWRLNGATWEVIPDSAFSSTPGVKGNCTGQPVQVTNTAQIDANELPVAITASETITVS